jgi:hypothetical protein
LGIGIIASPNIASQVVQKILSALPSSGALGNQFRENGSQFPFPPTRVAGFTRGKEPSDLDDLTATSLDFAGEQL